MFSLTFVGMWPHNGPISILAPQKRATKPGHKIREIKCGHASKKVRSGVAEVNGFCATERIGMANVLVSGSHWFRTQRIPLRPRFPRPMKRDSANSWQTRYLRCSHQSTEAAQMAL